MQWHYANNVAIEAMMIGSPLLRRVADDRRTQLIMSYRGYFAGTTNLWSVQNALLLVLGASQDVFSFLGHDCFPFETSEFS
jgi:hypothetical protein